MIERILKIEMKLTVFLMMKVMRLSEMRPVMGLSGQNPSSGEF
jgi:hypothetical protein